MYVTTPADVNSHTSVGSILPLPFVSPLTYFGAKSSAVFAIVPKSSFRLIASAMFPVL